MSDSLTATVSQIYCSERWKLGKVAATGALGSMLGGRPVLTADKSSSQVEVVAVRNEIQMWEEKPSFR